MDDAAAARTAVVASGRHDHDGSGCTSMRSRASHARALRSRWSLVGGPASNWGVDGGGGCGLAVVVGEGYRARGVEGLFQGSGGRSGEEKGVVGAAGGG